MEIKYIPEPLDTEEICLPEELDELIEQLAKNVHETWAKSRMEQGWTYGKYRNDMYKQHPCLVPFENLRESEKEYDRNTAIQTLKFVLSKGFKISKDR